MKIKTVQQVLTAPAAHMVGMAFAFIIFFRMVIS